MKPRRSNQRNRAMTLTEVLVVIVVLGVLAAVFLPALLPPVRRASRINCVNNVKQIILAFLMWADDNKDKYPMEISTANGGTKELAETGDAFSTFQIMTNELSTPAILHCPVDTAHIMATSWGPKFYRQKRQLFSSVWTPTRIVPRQFSPAMIILPSAAFP